MVATVLITLLSSCNVEVKYTIHSNNSEYKTFVLQEGFALFSFEYPTKYRISGVHYNKTINLETVTLSGYYLHEQNDETLVYISALLFDGTPPSSVASLSSMLVPYQNESGFKLISESAIIVGGNNAWSNTFFYQRPRPSAEQAKGLKPAPTLQKEIYFNQNNIVWHLFMRAPESTSVDELAAFAHIIQSFTLLN